MQVNGRRIYTGDNEKQACLEELLMGVRGFLTELKRRKFHRAVLLYAGYPRELPDQTPFWTANDLESRCRITKPITTRIGLMLAGMVKPLMRQECKSGRYQ